jgi:hypothetical protein
MIDSIVESTMRKAILRFAKNNNSEPNQHQILIAYDTNTLAPKYKHLSISGSKEIPFLEILNVRFDLLNREMMVAQFISKTFQRYATEYETLPQNIFVVIALKSDDDEIELSLYKGNEFKKQIDLEQLIGM